MKSIQSILQTNGVEFIDDIMNDYLVVYEKLNASTLSFKRIGNELKFYKGRDNEEITNLNETLYSYFKDGIEYIRRTSLIFYMEFPEGWLFRTQYFNPNAPGLVNYDTQPQNNLVLSCIDTGNSVIEDLTVLKKWAGRLHIDVSEPVFSGFLSEFQKEKIFNYINGKCECDGIPFSQYIISILNPAVSHSAYSDTFNTNMDSFIFKFYKAGSKKSFCMKLVDPYMDELIKQNKDKFGANSGTENEIILANFVAWLQTIDMNEIQISGDTSDERYFDLLCKLFNQYMKKQQNLFKDMKSNVNESYAVNIDKIKNEETAKLLKDNPVMTTAFQVIVGSFMNTKENENDPMSIMDDTLKDMFNKEVSSIKRLTDSKDEQVKSFTELLKSSMNDIEAAAKDSKSEKVMSFSELMDKIGSSNDEEDMLDEPEEHNDASESNPISDEENDSNAKDEVEKIDGPDLDIEPEHSGKPDEPEKKEESEDTSKTETSSDSNASKSSAESGGEEKSDESESEQNESEDEEEEKSGEKSDESEDEEKESEEKSDEPEDEESEEKSDESEDEQQDEKESTEDEKDKDENGKQDDSSNEDGGTPDKKDETENKQPEPKKDESQPVEGEEIKDSAPEPKHEEKPQQKESAGKPEKPEKKKPEPKPAQSKQQNADGGGSL